MGTVRHLWRSWSDAFSGVASGAQDVCVRARSFPKSALIRLRSPEITHSRVVIYPAMPQGDFPLPSLPLKGNGLLEDPGSAPWGYFCL